MNQRTANVIAQLAGWLLFFSFPVLFINNQNSQNDLLFLFRQPSYYVFCFTFLALYYTVNNFLIPRLYLKKRFIAFFLVLLILLIGLYLMKPFDGLMSVNRQNFDRASAGRPGPPPGEFHFDAPRPGDGKPRQGIPPGDRPPGSPRNMMHVDIVSIFLFITLVALSMAIQITRQLELTRRQAVKAEADRSEAELSFLRAQINPHFLFNTLNNIYTLAVTNSGQTAESIMKLSNIMRYVTDDVSLEYVPLNEELDCISNFIGLQELRLGSNAVIDYSVNGSTENKKIAPLMLMTFIENAFKYGISKQSSSPITILISTSEREVHLFVQNKIFSKGSKISSTGIGIKNTRQRLQHLYPGRHRLSVSDRDDLFTVNLQIFLS